MRNCCYVTRVRGRDRQKEISKKLQRTDKVNRRRKKGQEKEKERIKNIYKMEWTKEIEKKYKDDRKKGKIKNSKPVCASTYVRKN